MIRTSSRLQLFVGRLKEADMQAASSSLLWITSPRPCRPGRPRCLAPGEADPSSEPPLVSCPSGRRWSRHRLLPRLAHRALHWFLGAAWRRNGANKYQSRAQSTCRQAATQAALLDGIGRRRALLRKAGYTVGTSMIALRRWREPFLESATRRGHRAERAWRAQDGNDHEREQAVGGHREKSPKANKVD
jgi:hypothetical protein